MSRIACQEVASAKILARFASTFFASVPTSATLMENNGLRAAIATVSAVEVLPTPGGPTAVSRLLYSDHMRSHHKEVSPGLFLSSQRYRPRSGRYCHLANLPQYGY